MLVEEIDPSDGTHPAMKLAAGERRLRACRWGAVNRPDNPHFAALPAVVCPGPLPDEERRIWQLVENLARESLRPGELAAAVGTGPASSGGYVGDLPRVAGVRARPQFDRRAPCDGPSGAAHPSDLA